MNEDQYILKMTNAGRCIHEIAQKLGCTEEHIHQRLLAMENAILHDPNGYGALADQFTKLCKSYEEVGERLKQLGTALHHRMTAEELRGLVSNSKEHTIAMLQEHAIVLHRYQRPPDDSGGQNNNAKN